VTFSIPLTVPLGSYSITVRGSSSGVSHDALLTLTAAPVARTYQQGSSLYLEVQGDNETARVGLETQSGGSIVEVSLNGTNFVNEHDTGREVQPAFYDGSAKYDSCAGCTGVFGWDPVQGGDRYDHGSPVLTQSLSADSIFVKTQPYQWNPDDKGGGPTQPVLSDTYYEETLSQVPNHSRAFKAQYSVTHFGTDEHSNSPQEFPAVYVNLGFDRFVRYGGTAPWTNEAVTSITPPAGSSPNFYNPEQWAAFVNEQDVGLTVYIPGSSLTTSLSVFRAPPDQQGTAQIILPLLCHLPLRPAPFWRGTST